MKVLKSVAAIIALGATQLPAMAQDATAGERVFRKCMACHTVEEGKNKSGPSLFGIVGRKAGTVEGFRYSKANKDAGEAGLIWTEEELTVYLANPRSYMPGTRMAFAGLRNAEETANLIAYLKEQKPEEEAE